VSAELNEREFLAALRRLERAGFVELEGEGDDLRLRVPGFADQDDFPEGEVEAETRDTLAVAWRETFGDDPLPADVEERALGRMLDGGVSGVPGMCLIYNVDPIAALAEALVA
jgi:hypothetical protein